MNRKKDMVMKRSCVVLLIAAMLVTMLPLASTDSSVYAASVGTFNYGRTITDAKGKAYSWKRSMMAPAYWWDAEGRRIADKAATYESSTAGLERYTIRTGGKTVTGYCVAHGIRVDTSTRLKSVDDLSKWTHTGAYPYSSRQGIKYTLIYGYQDGRHISDLANNGFSKSKYWHKTADSYTADDWYIATQVLIWEYQQLTRTDSIKGGHGKQHNGLVGADHYFDIIKGRAAQDIYNYMITRIKKHATIASFAKGKKADADNSKGWLMKKDGATGYYTCTLKDGNQINVNIKAAGTSSKNWEVKKNGNAYTFIYKGKSLSEEGISFKFSKQIPLLENGSSGDMLIWSWSSAGSLRQAVATGMPKDPVSMYIKFRSGGEGEEIPKEGEPEPKYWPTFEFPVHKDDKNPGWDGDACTPMGDAVLNSTFVLYRNGKEVDRVTLDEYGSTEVLTDQPWISLDDLTKTPSGTYIHTEADADGNVTTHCTVAPTRLEWNNTEKVEYEIVEIPAYARFTEGESGTGSGSRKYEVSFYALTDDSRTCVTQDPAWSDIEYAVNYKTTEGTNDGDETARGTSGSLDDQLSMNQETFINDNWRGKLLIKKQKESEDVFNEEGSSGSLNLSTKSHWKMYLNSGGYEDHPYLRFVEDGHTEDGAKKYKAVRDTSGYDNASTDMEVSDTGSLFITDIPYGSYTVEEVKADDESFVLESFQVDIDQDAKQYTKSITNKKKENVIKVVKTDAETGKQVNMKGTKFYIRYMGNHLLADPTKSENYGRLLPNASDINSSSKDYTFVCNSYGEIVLPYDLEFGTYRLEEFLLPDGYFVGTYGEDGKGADADYGESGEYGKDDDGKAKPDMSWETVKDGDPANDLVAVYDKDGKKVEYKAGDIFNFYTFKVEKQDGHMDGEEYTKYYKAVAMKNNPVKGKIEIEKEGEILAGFEKTEKDGFTVWTPKYIWGKLKDAVFGIYAAIDEWLSDGSDGSQIYDTESGKEIKIPTEKKTHSGENGADKIFEEGAFDHGSGARLYYRLDREASIDNRYTRIYTTPEQKPTTYKASIERIEGGLRYRYDIEADMTYNAGGLNYTDVRITKVTSVLAGFATDIPTTEATSVVGGTAYSPAINVGDADGNVFDINKQVYTYETDGTKVYDTDGSLTHDLADIGAKRYTVKDYKFYKLTAADIAAEERVTEEGIDLDGDGKYDKEGEKEPVKETRTAFEWGNDVTLVSPVKNGKAIAKAGDDAYEVLTENYDWVSCSQNGTPEAQYQVPDGWTEIPYIPDIEVDEGEVTVKNTHYSIIMKTDGEGTSYRVLLDDGTWQDCDAKGNFKKMVVEEYRSSYTQQADNENGFTFELDGITISSQALKDGTAKTVIQSPYDVTPVIETGIGYTQETESNTTTFTATEPSAPLYFMSAENIKTEMYYFGSSTRTLLTIPMKAVEGNYEKVIPSITFTRTGEIVDWFSKLSPDAPVYSRECAYGNTVKAVRHEGGKDSDVYYTIEIVSDQTIKEGDGPFEITYPDGYNAKVYKDKSAAGNDVGVLVMDGVYKTSTAALGDLVETLTTGEDGKAVSGELPLGKYIIRELSAPNGYVADNEKFYEVELKYKDQFTPLVWESLTSTNKYVEVELDFTKMFETGYQSDTYNKDDGAVFGIYNAASISYDKAALPADTLIDTIKVQPDGKTVTSTKIPEGVYYLKELTTKNTHILNDTPFYFVAGDGIKSVPLEISKDEDGKDADGTTLKAVMDGYGVATITVETLNRYPAARMKVDGKQYVLDTDAESEDGRVIVKTHKDMAKTKITVRSGETVDVELANGKTLRFAVDGNTYTYAYDGQQGTYIPTVAYTGYYADFTAEEKQADVNNPVVKTIVFADTDNSSAVTAQTVYTPVMVENPDNKDEQIQKTDNDGNKVFDYHVDVKLTAGTLVSAILGKTEVNLEELADGRIAVNKETTLKLTAETGAAYLIKVDKDGNVRMSLSNVQEGAMAEQAPTVTVNSVPATAGLNIYRSITTARQDSSAKRLQIKINTTDNINAGEIKNDAKETTPPPPPEPGPSPSTPYIGTTATDSETKDHIVNADSRVTIVDAVAYRNLTPGKEYVINGVLMDKDTGKVLLANGREVTAEKSFTPKSADGKVNVEFTFDGSALAGKTIVVYETLYQDGREVAVHKDMDDKKQTVHFPQIGTTAMDRETNAHVSKADKKVTVIDEVKYHNLIAGREYKVRGVLMDKADGKILLVDGKPVTSERIFKPDHPNGTVTLSFTFDGSKLAGTAVVVYESLELAANGKIVASHKDISDEKQTIRFPNLRTTASHAATGLIKDTVEYWQLTKGEEYTLKAVLMDKVTRKPVYCNGEKVTTTRQFEASANHGKVTVPLYFRQADLYGKEVVVFEYLYRNGKLIGSHEDWNDKAQTVKFSKPVKPDTPAKPGRKDIPQTGDTSRLMLYIFLALAGISIILGIRKRKK